MAYPRNIVPKEEGIFPLHLVPNFCTVKRAWVEMKNSFTFFDERRTDPPSKQETETDATDSTQEGRRHRWLECKLSLRDEIPRKHQQCFIRNGKAKDSQHEQGEQCPIAIFTDPREYGFHREVFWSDERGKSTSTKRKRAGLAV